MSGWGYCVQHLRRTQVVPPSCNVDNVVGMIRNGSVLCRLLNVLQPFSIDSKRISINPKNSKFLSQKNITVFLERCQDVFGFRREDLFEVNDLLNEENLDKVLKTLLQLFSSPQAQAHNSQGFRRSSLAPPLEETSLKKQRIPLPPSEESYDVHQEEEEKIYYRAIDIMSKNETLEKKSTKQLRIDELISTEKKYINILKGLIEIYKVKLAKILSVSDLDFVFLLIEKMLAVHKSFYEDLTETLNVDSRMTVAECFISKKEKFLLYGEYCFNVAKIQNFVDSLLEQPIYRDVIKDCQTSWPEVDIKFRDLFVIPMQRILKYPLFLKSCLDHMPKEDHVERKIFSKALEEVEDLAQYVNEMKRDYENIDNIDRIESSIKDIDSKLIKGAHLKDYGRLLKDGEVKCKTSNKMCMLFLFDRLLLLCFKQKDGMLELNKHFMVSHFHLVSKQKNDKCFALLNEQQITEFKARTKEERDDWLKKIEVAKDNISPVVPWNADTPPPNLAIFTYKEITICDVCKKLLRGLFFQGYHCNNPRINVHKDCIPKVKDILIQSTNSDDLSSEEWFAGDINRPIAESILRTLPDGSYLIRTKGLSYVICLKFEVIHHIMVDIKHGQFGIGNKRYFPRIQDLVQFYGKTSLDHVHPKLQTTLIYPFKCFSNRRSNVCT